MAEIEVENTYYEPVTETETVHICDACGEPCEENGGRYPVVVRGGWDENYDLCEYCVRTLDETERALETTAHPTPTELTINTETLYRSIVEWGQRALVWTRGSAWRFTIVFIALWISAGMIGTVIEPLGGLAVLVLLGWLGYEAYRTYNAGGEFVHQMEERVAKGETRLQDIVARGRTELQSLSNDEPEFADAPEVAQQMDSRQSTRDTTAHPSVPESNATDGAEGRIEHDGNVPFDWYGDAEVGVNEVFAHIDTDLDPQTKAHIETSVEKHRDRGEPVDAADIRWVAEAADELDLGGSHR